MIVALREGRTFVNAVGVFTEGPEILHAGFPAAEEDAEGGFHGHKLHSQGVGEDAFA